MLTKTPHNPQMLKHSRLAAGVAKTVEIKIFFLLTKKSGVTNEWLILAEFL